MLWQRNFGCRYDERSRGDYADELRKYSEHRKKSHKKRKYVLALHWTINLNLNT